MVVILRSESACIHTHNILRSNSTDMLTRFLASWKSTDSGVQILQFRFCGSTSGPNRNCSSRLGQFIKFPLIYIHAQYPLISTFACSIVLYLSVSTFTSLSVSIFTSPPALNLFSTIFPIPFSSSTAHYHFCYTVHRLESLTYLHFITPAS